MALLKIPKHQFLFFLALFFVINLLQSTYTGLLEDEAYYWVWSENLAWGYFDHPPMVAVFIWLGGLLFDGELGVRIISVLSFCLIIWFMWKTIDYKDKSKHIELFFLLIVSLALLQVYGFISTPDTPLMLFTAVFFWVYKRFLSNADIKNTLILGFSMAAMLYSKYHGLLIIVFVLLSNLELLKNSKFWMASLFGLILFAPHLIWQYDNGFPSFVYHLKERGSKPYHIGFTLNHLLNVLVIVGITFPVVYAAFFKKKAQNQLDKSFKFVVYGFVLFFLLSSFKSQPQAQWLAAILVPICIFTFPVFAENARLRKWLYQLGLTQLVIIIIARVLLASPSLSPVLLEPHLAETWVEDLQDKTSSKPLVFVNSYQNASVYRFYTGIETHSFGIPRGRKSQYSMLDTESRMQKKDIFAVGKQLTERSFLVKKADDSLYGYEINPFRSFQGIKCLIEEELLEVRSGQLVRVPFKLINPYDHSVPLDNAEFFGVFQGEKKIVLHEVPLDLSDIVSLDAGQEINLVVDFTIPELIVNKSLTFRIGVSFQGLPPGIQGNKVLVNYIPDTSKD